MEGGWDKWDKEVYDKKGLGGSETFIIKYAHKLSDLGYNVKVFCRCDNKVIEGVEYIPIELYSKYCAKYYIDYSLINRCPEYLPINYHHNINTYLILHDLSRDGEIIIRNNSLKGILCISPWHIEYLANVFPQFKDITKYVSYGIDHTLYNNNTKKIKNSFIYSSFPNRGLIHLLRIFEKIIKKYPDATLNIFCDTKHKFVQQHNKKDMDEIDKLLIKLQKNVTNHGWVSGEVLREWWMKSEYWLYPCTFAETCCLTAYEAACSKTLAITNHLAALKDSVGDRGIIFREEIGSDKWEKEIMEIIDNLFNGKINKNIYIDKNYEWIKNKNYDNVVGDFVKNYLEN
jgi:hypothetical protein